MPDYLSRYDETQRVELPGGFWVDVKKCLTGTQMRTIRGKQITRGIEDYKDPDGKEMKRSVIVKIDADLYAYELAVASIVDWNFETERAHYDLLDEADQDEIEGVCIELNAEPTRKEGATFPVVGQGGVPTGEDKPSDDS
jgi:hypothetical protein